MFVSNRRVWTSNSVHASSCSCREGRTPDSAKLRTSPRSHWRSCSFITHPPSAQRCIHHTEISYIIRSSVLSHVYHAQCPPSILRSEPVMNELASLTRNTAAPRYSFGADNRPSMFCVGQVSFRSGYLTNNSSTICVTMYPGEMVLTRILC